MTKKIFILTLIVLSTAACTELMQVATTVASNSLSTGTTVTTADNVSGLKSALNLGIEKAVSGLSATDGFYKDAVLKLVMPDDAKAIVDNIKLIPGGQALVDKAVLSMNRSAEDAVKEATPIFKNAIINMSFSDVTGVLFGGKNAATEYLRKTTYNSLKSAFAPKIQASLAKPLVAGVSTTKTWSSLTSAYNSVAGTAVGSVAGMKKVNTNLQEYVTERALDALFTKIATEENEIRTNPTARVSAILQKVFGQLDSKK